MQISLAKAKDNVIININAATTEVFLHPNLSEADLAKYEKVDSIAIAVGESAVRASRKLAGGGLLVSLPGEYEKSEVFISAQVNHGEDEASASSANLDVVEVEAEGVRVMYYASAKAVNKKLIADMGVIDVLVLEVASDFSQQLKAVSSIDPQIVVPVSADKELLGKFKTELGANFTEEKKLKVKSTDFANEEYVMQGVQLEL